MATISINIDDAQLSRVINALSTAFGYEEFVELVPGEPLVPNPETRGQFVRREIIERLKRNVLAQEAKEADAAYQSSQPDPGIS